MCPNVWGSGWRCMSRDTSKYSAFVALPDRGMALLVELQDGAPQRGGVHPADAESCRGRPAAVLVLLGLQVIEQSRAIARPARFAGEVIERLRVPVVAEFIATELRARPHGKIGLALLE